MNVREVGVGRPARRRAVAQQRQLRGRARPRGLGERELDPGEFLDVLAATPDELLAACRDGVLTDSKTLTGLLWLQNTLSGAWQLDWQPAPAQD